MVAAILLETELEAGVSFRGVDWLAAVVVGTLLETELDISRYCGLLVEEESLLDVRAIEGDVVGWKISERRSLGSSCGQLTGHV